MTVLRIGLAQVDLVVGDLAANAAMIEARTRQAAEAGAQLVVFPEMTLTGYPPEDLVLRRSFREASLATLDRLAADLAAAGLGEVAVIVGYVGSDAGPRNAAAFLQAGAVVATYFKHHLPSYGVFDEARNFIAGQELTVVRFGGIDIGLTICEDVWQDGGPFTAAALAKVGLLININGSPYERGKDDVRLSLLARRAVEAGAPVAYVNQVGGQDELVFDGDSLVVDAAGQLIARAPQFQAGLYCVELNLPAATTDPGQLPASAAGLAVRRAVAPLAPPVPAGALVEPLSIAE
ncbi:MAG: nitrilase-related carbon-nitrogen hydrolase, partial [Jatrophihabitantaceae bacterium]